MGEDHTPGKERRPPEIAAPERGETQRPDAQRQGKPKQRQQTDVGRPRPECEQRSGGERGSGRDTATHRRAPAVPPPAEQRPDGHQRDEGEGDGAAGGVEEGRADRELDTEAGGEDGVERADQHHAQDHGQE
jgi:hypothetical protein